MSLDVARAFAFHSYVTGDLEFLRDRAWPILSGVADWVVSRAAHTERGCEIRAAMGIAERETERRTTPAFTNMAAAVVLRDAIHAAEKLGRAAIIPNGLGSQKVSVFQSKGTLSVSARGLPGR